MLLLVTSYFSTTLYIKRHGVTFQEMCVFMSGMSALT